MSLRQRLGFRLRALGRGARRESNLDEELRFHLEMEASQNVRQGMSPEEARYAAMRRFGGVEQIKEQVRDAWGSRLRETLWQDVRFGFRNLRKNPGFTAVVVLTLALGIGANSAIFSVIYGVLLRPLPYPRGEQLVVLRQQAPRRGVDDWPFSVREVFDYRKQNRTLLGVAEYHTMWFVLLGRAEPERVQTGVVSWSFFELLGVKPLLGRTFVPEDEQTDAPAVLVLSHEYWRRSHGGDPAVIGRTFEMNDRIHTVVGVLPPHPQYPNANDVYMPTSACPFRAAAEREAARDAGRMMSVFGRVKEGVGLAQVRADVRSLADRFRQENQDTYPVASGYAATALPLYDVLTQRARPTFLILLGTVSLVLLIACANVANLTLARMASRGRELALRAALGAGRARLIRQLLTESSLLALAGGTLGLALAAGGLSLLVTFASRFSPRASEVAIDGYVLAFTLAVSLITGIVVGLAPALSTRQSSRRTRRRRRAFAWLGRKGPFPAGIAGGPGGGVVHASHRGGADAAQLSGLAASRSRLPQRKRAHRADRSQLVEVPE